MMSNPYGNSRHDGARNGRHAHSQNMKNMTDFEMTLAKYNRNSDAFLNGDGAHLRHRGPRDHTGTLLRLHQDEHGLDDVQSAITMDIDDNYRASFANTQQSSSLMQSSQTQQVSSSSRDNKSSSKTFSKSSKRQQSTKGKTSQHSSSCHTSETAGTNSTGGTWGMRMVPSSSGGPNVQPGTISMRGSIPKAPFVSLAQAKEAIRSLELELDNARQEKLQEEEEQVTLATEIEELQGISKEISNENDELVSDIQDLMEENDELVDETKHCDITIRKCSDELTKLVQERDDLKIRLEELEESQRMPGGGGMKDAVSQLKQSMNRTLQEVEQEKQSLEVSIDELRSELEQMQDDMSKLLSERLRISKRLKGIKALEEKCTCDLRRGGHKTEESLENSKHQTQQQAPDVTDSSVDWTLSSHQTPGGGSSHGSEGPLGRSWRESFQKHVNKHIADDDNIAKKGTFAMLPSKENGGGVIRRLSRIKNEMRSNSITSKEDIDVYGLSPGNNNSDCGQRLSDGLAALRARDNTSSVGGSSHNDVSNDPSPSPARRIAKLAGSASGAMLEVIGAPGLGSASPGGQRQRKSVNAVSSKGPMDDSSNDEEPKMLGHRMRLHGDAASASSASSRHSGSNSRAKQRGSTGSISKASSADILESPTSSTNRRLSLVDKCLRRLSGDHASNNSASEEVRASSPAVSPTRSQSAPVSKPSSDSKPCKRSASGYASKPPNLETIISNRAFGSSVDDISIVSGASLHSRLSCRPSMKRTKSDSQLQEEEEDDSDHDNASVTSQDNGKCSVFGEDLSCHWTSHAAEAEALEKRKAEEIRKAGVYFPPPSTDGNIVGKRQGSSVIPKSAQREHENPIGNTKKMGRNNQKGPLPSNLPTPEEVFKKAREQARRDREREKQQNNPTSGGFFARGRLANLRPLGRQNSGRVDQDTSDGNVAGKDYEFVNKSASSFGGSFNSTDTEEVEKAIMESTPAPRRFTSHGTSNLHFDPSAKILNSRQVVPESASNQNWSRRSDQAQENDTRRQSLPNSRGVASRRPSTSQNTRNSGLSRTSSYRGGSASGQPRSRVAQSLKEKMPANIKRSRWGSKVFQ